MAHFYQDGGARGCEPCEPASRHRMPARWLTAERGLCADERRPRWSVPFTSRVARGAQPQEAVALGTSACLTRHGRTERRDWIVVRVGGRWSGGGGGGELSSSLSSFSAPSVLPSALARKRKRPPCRLSFVSKSWTRESDLCQCKTDYFYAVRQHNKFWREGAKTAILP